MKLGHGGSKTRSLGQIIEKHCVHSGGHSFDPKFMKLCQIVYQHHIYMNFESGSCWVKTRSLGQILEKPGVHSRGHKLDYDFMKLCQQVNHHYVQVKLETWSCWVKNYVARSNLRKTLCTL